MSKADDYNKAQFAAGKLKPAHLTALALEYQRAHKLDVDGFIGPATLAALDASTDGRPSMPGPRVYPIRALRDGRRPTVTSQYYTKNPSRANPDRPHRGVDLFFAYDAAKDPPQQLGDGGRYEKWWVPEGQHAIASADGIVHAAAFVGKSVTGYRCWIQHGSGYHTGYFHLKALLVVPGAAVKAGDPVGVISDDPSAFDARHLHFEVYQGDLRAYPKGSFDPEIWLAGASVLAS